MDQHQTRVNRENNRQAMFSKFEMSAAIKNVSGEATNEKFDRKEWRSPCASTRAINVLPSLATLSRTQRIVNSASSQFRINNRRLLDNVPRQRTYGQRC
jgi:hypothetical protein